MQEDGVGIGERHQRIVHHEAVEHLDALVGLVFLPHRRPDVRVDHVRVAHGLTGITHQRDIRPLGARDFQHDGVGLIAFRAGQPQREVEPLRGLDPRVRHVVAVADPRNALPLVAAEELPHGQQVGEDLARMRQVGEPVDDGDVGVAGKLLDVGVRVRTDHDPVAHPRQHARHVADRLAAPQLDIARRQEERVPAQVVRPHFERDAGARGRFHEDHRQRLAGQRLARVPLGANVLGEHEQAVELGGREVENAEEVAVGFHGTLVRGTRKVCASSRGVKRGREAGVRPAPHASAAPRGCTSANPHPPRSPSIAPARPARRSSPAPSPAPATRTARLRAAWSSRCAGGAPRCSPCAS